ncbi:MAG: outer membrane protein assembly factor BamA [Gammaproteobacteria bacterium]|nr:outer membrane protein assembly factor BamA [Gammaproteobacteria bacterium]
MKKLLVVLVLFLNGFVAPVFAADAFVVRHIDVEGLQRIDSETVYSYLPIKRGEVLRPEKTTAIIKSLYKTGFFDHITLSRNGDTLIIHVIERPTIGQLKITGNSVIPTDKLTSVMKSLDIAEGRVYNRAILDRIKQSLLNQYFELGRYNARIDIDVSPLPRNRVLVKIDISEGITAKIRRITIIGNHAYSEKKLVQQLTITRQGLLTFFTQTDQYSQEKLDASLEGLRNFYLDRGYLKVNVKSSQVSITPDRKSVYVTIVVEEGEKYTVKGFTLTGEFVVPRSQLIGLIRIKPGDTFSRQVVMDSEKAISDELGKVGYIYATINLNPTIDEKNRTVFLDFNLKAGKRMYVRHIYFTDNTKTNDEVLRREMQQMEGGVASTGAMEESKRRLNLLPYLKDTEMSVVPVPNKDNQVDLNYKVTENNSAELTGRIGYSQAQHVILGAGVNQKNFLGTGKTLGLNVETSRYQRFYGASYTDPYFTTDGISRSVNISASRVDPGQANLTKSYTMNEYDISDTYSIPFGPEKNAINRLDLGYGYQNTLITFANSRTNVSTLVADFANRHGRHFQQFDLMMGLSRDSRDRAIFPTRGARQAIGLNLFLPAESQSLRYYTMNYSGAWFHPIVNNFLVTARGAIGYGNSFSNGEDYPFFKNFYAGGIGSVRGFTTNTLGPKDNTPNHQSTGGNLLADASLGLILPNYISDNLRTTLFVDAGNVYQTFDNRKYGGTGSGPLRYSAGISAEWLSPMGPIEVSMARPINVRPGDDLKAFDFSLGANFG